jgi:hypothetical protein
MCYDIFSGFEKVQPVWETKKRSAAVPTFALTRV